MTRAARLPLEFAANDEEGCGNSAFMVFDEAARHQDIETSVSAVSGQGMGVVHSVLSMPMVSWQTWRLINLTDGGWIRVIPTNVSCERFLVDACGSWVMATPAGGVKVVEAVDLPAYLQWVLDLVGARKDELPARELADTLRAMNLEGLSTAGGSSSTWSVEPYVVQAASPTISMRASRNILVTVSRQVSHDGFDVDLRVGPTRWVGRMYSEMELRTAVGVIRQAGESRLEFNKAMMARATSRRFVSELLREQAGLGQAVDIQVLAVAPILIDVLDGTGGQILSRIATMSLPRMMDGVFSRLQLPTMGVEIAAPSLAADSAYQVVAMVDGQPAGFAVPLASLAGALSAT
jgi:hypothetical protein